MPVARQAFTRLTHPDQRTNDIFSDIYDKLAAISQAQSSGGFTGVLTLAKITTSGSNGSMSLVNGKVSSVTAPT